MAAPRVLHLISSLRVGGAERLLVSTLRAAMGNPDADFTVIIMNDEVDPGLLAELENTGFPVIRLHRREGHLHPKYLRQILAIIDRNKIGLLHTHNEGSRTWGMLAKLLRPSLKLVYTVHAEGVGHSINGLKRAAYLRLTDATVAISRSVEAECRAFGARAVHRIENGVDLAAFRRAARPKHDAPLPRLINVARFQPIKGQDILIAALAICHARGVPLPLTLVGAGGNSPFFEQIARQVADAGLSSHVTFAIDRTDIPDLLAQGDIFVLPSRQEGFGLALIEAMAAGLPVIASRTGGPADLIVEDRNGLMFEPGNADDLAEKILLLAKDSARQTGFVAEGQSTADRYDINATLAAHLALYRQMV